MDIKENTEALFSQLENFLKTETVVGKPIKVEDVTLVPFITVNFGCATGGGGQGKMIQLKFFLLKTRIIWIR